MGGQSKTDISPWARAASGATGAVLANALVYPLDMYEPDRLPRGRYCLEIDSY